MVKHPPLAQVMTLASWEESPALAPHRGPASPSAYVSASLCVSHGKINKIFKKQKNAAIQKQAMNISPIKIKLFKWSMGT